MAQKMSGYKRYKLLIVGDGDAYEDLQSLSQDQVILAGRKPYEEIPAYIAASDICLLPANHQEKIMQNIVPIKMYEYMAMGKPVVTTKLPAIVKEFGMGNGVVYADNSENVFSICRGLVFNGSREEQGLRARNFVRNRSWEKIAKAFETVIKNTARGI